MPEDTQWQKYCSRFKTYPALLDPPESLVGMVVCIPVFAEPDLIGTLESLLQCDLPPTRVEIIVLFNRNDRMTNDEESLHRKTWNECQQWVHRHNGGTLQYKPIQIDTFPDPKGGVGWARKIVMDEAAQRAGSEGLLICLDADCTVAKNYLTAIYSFFAQHPNCNAASIYFEHHLDPLDTSVRDAIVQYELHLRYLVHALRWSGHPFAFQTVGSAMAVRRGAYLAQGGMNTRQAGEDFYFLQKFIELNSLGEIRDTIVFPSARISHRVPFGTGRAMQSLLSESTQWMTTDFQVFRHIKPLLGNVEQVRNVAKDLTITEPYVWLQHSIGLQEGVLRFLESIDFIAHCRSVEKHTTSLTSFRQRYFRYFNAFMMIRYMHYMVDHGYPEVQIGEASRTLAVECKLLSSDVIDPEELLFIYRNRDRLKL